MLSLLRLRIRGILAITSYVVLVLVVSGVDSCNGGKTVDITILHTNDIHSHYRPDPAGSENNPYHLGGLARLKTLVDKLRAKKPNSLLLDGGDWSEGSMYYTTDAGATMLKLMDAIGYDAVVVGNHDFLNGPGHLATRIETANPSLAVLGANHNLSLVPEEDRDRLESAMYDYALFEIEGVKVGVIGLLCDDAVYYPYFKPGIVTNPVEKATELSKYLHDNKLADVIVLLSHNSFDKQVVWAKQVPWVNVIVSGHSHHKIAQPEIVDNAGRPVYVVESRQWAHFLGELTLSVDTQTKQVKMKKYTLHAVDGTHAEDPKIAAMIDKAEQDLAAKYGKDIVHDHIGDCTDEMRHDTGREGPLGNFVVDSFRAAAGTDMGLETNLLTNIGLQPGPLSTMAVTNVSPHIYGPLPDAKKPFPEFGRTWTVKRLTMRGGDFKALMNLTLLAESVGVPLGWLSTSGLRIVYSKSDGASPLQSMEVFNENTRAFEPIQENRNYTIALHDGMLLALTELVSRLGLDVDLSQVEDTGIQTWEALLGMVAEKRTIRAADFEAGRRYHTLEADLSFYAHSVKAVPGASDSGQVIQVTVQNEGLTATTAGYRLRVLRGAPNDWLNDDTSGNEKTPIGPDAAIPPLNPGERAVVEIPWQNHAGAGVYSLRVRMYTPDGANDGNPRNNLAKRHFRIPTAHQ